MADIDYGHGGTTLDPSDVPQPGDPSTKLQANGPIDIRSSAQKAGAQRGAGDVSGQDAQRTLRTKGYWEGPGTLKTNVKGLY